MGGDVRLALQEALKRGGVFATRGGALDLFREAVATAIGAIERHERGALFQEFLLKGPYEDLGPIPEELVGQRLSDDQVASVICFIFSSMVNCFKGAVTELLAAGASTRLVGKLQREGELPANARLYVGDAVWVPVAGRRGVLKGADQYILIDGPGSKGITIAGVGEVKSYFKTDEKLRKQLDQHLKRSRQGLQVAREDYSEDQIQVGYGPRGRVLRIMVLPSDWPLPRTLRFEKTKRGRALQVEPGVPRENEDTIEKGTQDGEWRITLRWSKEAIAEAAYEMTFWYMAKVGEAIYSERRPKGVEKMSPGEAGCNAAKMMLYYAIRRYRTPGERQRAIALYNSYGFGYALGMNFKDPKGRREMLWPQDLDEILSAGKTQHGCRIH